jgi:thiol-disulfide isomerase/thioredoxin
MKKSSLPYLLIITVVLALFPRCNRSEKTAPEFSADSAVNSEAIDWDSLPEIDSDVRQALEELGIPVIERPIPLFDFSAELLDGTTLRLSDLKGKLVFLNFWATWCGPCRMEMPSMEAQYQRFKDRGFEILAVNYMESNSDVSAFMDEMNLSFPAALDPKGDIAGIYAIDAFPTTYLIDRNGKIITRLVGAIDWEMPELTGLFEFLLNRSDE